MMWDVFVEILLVVVVIALASVNFQRILINFKSHVAVEI
jgi:hypothetical protein